MDCKHCGAKVNAGTEWEAHLSRHQTIQNRVHAGRTYGVSYQRRPPRAIQTPTETPVTSQSTEVSVDKNADGKSDQVVCWALIADRYVLYSEKFDCNKAEHPAINLMDIGLKNAICPFQNRLACSNAKNAILCIQVSGIVKSMPNLVSQFSNQGMVKWQMTKARPEGKRTMRALWHFVRYKKHFMLMLASHQLDIHYDWHWGLQRDYEIEKAQASHKYPDREYSSIPERKKPSQKKRRDGEVVALSFVGPSDFTAGKW
ncbi:hypothetical protein AWENTII_004482 [Aspergillus wentii]